MRVGINMLLLEAGAGGVTNYVMTLVRSWKEVYPEDQLVLFSFPVNEALLSEIPAPFRDHEISLPGNNQKAILDHLDKFDVFFCPFGSLFPRPLPKPSVVTMVDIQERFFPAFFSQKDLANRLYHYDSSLIMSDQVITTSNFSHRSMTAVLGVPEEKVNVVYLCPDILPEEEERPPLPDDWAGPFVFYPANDWPHKNHLRLLEALALLRENGNTMRCVLTGSRSALFPALRQSIADLGLEGEVVHLGVVSRHCMAWLYRNADFLVFPSFFEGFGIPLVEAMSSALPIACSGISSIPEVVGDAALYFDPGNVADMAEKIHRLRCDKDMKSRLGAKGKGRQSLFDVRSLVEGHRAAFQKAIDSYRHGMYVRHRLIDAPRARAVRRRRVPARQREKAMALLSESITLGEE